MATGKKSFVFYSNWESTFDKLSDEEAGKLIKHMLHYVNDRDPIAPDRITEIVFEPLKAVLKDDLKKWDNIIEKRKESGRLGGLKSGETRSKTDQNEANEASALNASKNEANEAVNVNDNVNVNVIKEEKETFSTPLLKVKKRSQPDALQFPFSGIEFMKAWNELLTLPVWKKKPLSAIQKALNQLSKYDEMFSVGLIEKAHAGNYQGIVFDDTDEKFLKWKKQQNGQTIKTNPGGKLAGTYKAAEDFAREIEEKSRNFVSPLRNPAPPN